MTIDNKINSIHTSCKDCVFAIYEDKTQINCALQYIELYKSKNIEILEAYDNDKEFFIINGKKCMGHRENNWFDQFNMKDADLSEKIAKYNETNILNYIIIIDLKNLNLDQLDDICLQISQCKVQPKKVIFIRHIDNEKSFPYDKIENILKKYEPKYIWRIQTILDDSLTDKNILDNIALLNNKVRFMLYITNYNSDIKNVVEVTDNKVHQKLEQFNVISNKDKNCMIFSTIVYRFENFHGKDLLQDMNNYTIV